MISICPRQRSAYALLAAYAALSGCTAGPDFLRPAAPAAAGYTVRSPDAATQQGGDPDVQRVELGREIEGNWWTLFGSAAIDGIVREAIDRNYTLQSATATLAQARAIAQAAAGTRYPRLALTGGAGRQKYGDEFLGGFVNLPPFAYYAVGPVVSYSLDYTGGVARSVEREVALADYSRHELDAAYLAVTGQAVLQSLAVAAARAQNATLETIIGQDEENLKLVQTAFSEGSVPRAEVVSARSQLASDLTLLPPGRQELARARHALAVILGRTTANAPSQDLDLGSIRLPRELPVSLPSELVRRRPDILAAEAQLHAATSAVGVADSNLYPKIQLTATGGQQSLVPDQLFNRASTAWSLISGLTAPVFDGGSLRAERRAAVAAMHASAARYRETVLEAFAQVADALDALEHDADELAAQREAQAAAQSNLELARAGFKEGAAGVLRVLDAERQYQQSRLGYVRALAQRYLDTVQLFLALGGTSPEAVPATAAR